ncbi:MAG: phosphoribosylformylglycinamidine synthase II, phosphoribosylformylglycinamidine synthase [Microgenomates group bacterium GW2011_GWC1_41_8]|uniref:Phosphoribosylformylglycinamidine synthase subunit PurL n=2 Tax=Candidatus Roizmaniibacteriota TaxID=1752723 RepID=A0A0G0VI25_9BACT|nr:MAG: Phosphoribosylformylglycinamidine synthase 2 [Candidatus Levybacteria bacterium GW2011_GWA2_40_16]KKR71655.1 MAG: Phosphoribosylformylglycinamidine synthase 2 [Candidatus Roizmanbacteria bacterium GW2011_GWB1_40_7]KKR91130.1 MAG: Phosphoribosylformylglycinamidine synthase 2 [Candidatus Roizmanbacteria bacterium GW2011_GWA1_41_13]KKS23329.1 MAG: phosphoribosylformylglycinamidine synthase II, phosphoribosylformylglycinamidine synthase [Microgenomates group bacterium GW2011_GWC1_41_8]OGK48
MAVQEVTKPELHAIKVALIEEASDLRGHSVQKELMYALGIEGIVHIGTAEIFRYQGITQEEAALLEKKVFRDPILYESFVDQPLEEGDEKNTVRIEIAKKPGVMDPREESMRRVAGLYVITPEAVGTSTVYSIKGNLTLEQIEMIQKYLPSKLERVITEPPETLLLGGDPTPVETISITDLSAEELGRLSTIRRLFLDVDELRIVQEYYRSIGREPTDIELETIAQTRSEHNVHKTFKAELVTPDGVVKDSCMDRLRRSSERYYEKVGVVSAFKDNAGAIDAGNGKDAILFKPETHNHPVSIAPFAGADTKVGGVERDIAGTGRGGENLVGMMVNCLASPYMPRGMVPAGALHPKHLLLENSRGERNFANKMGIPTHGLKILFDPDSTELGSTGYIKPMSMGIAAGVIPLEHVQKGEPQAADLLLTIGGRTGRDGIHGANVSSGAMTHETILVDGTSVQEGNPIVQNKVFAAIEECRDAGLHRALTDCGGGGYSSAIGEIGEHVGVEVHLDKVPLKYAGLADWEIWLSESQERMVLAVPPENLEKFLEICLKYEVPADVIGAFTGDKQLRLKNKEQVVGELPMAFLHDGFPKRRMPVVYTETEEKNDVPEKPTDWQKTIEDVMSDLNVCSKEPMLRQYDMTVQGKTALEPFTGVYFDAPNDASVVFLRFGEPAGMVLAQGVNPFLMKEDIVEGTRWAVARAISNFVAHGGNPDKMAMADNVVWPGTDPEALGKLDRTIDTLEEMIRVIEAPFISGKDSMKALYDGPEGVIKNPPLLNVTVAGTIPDVMKTTSVDIKSSNSVLCVVGAMDTEHIGGSIYARTAHIENSHIPQLDTKTFPLSLRAIHDAIQAGKVKSCKSNGEGGIAAAISMMCFGGDCGAEIDLNCLGASRPDFALFNETAGSFVIEVADEKEIEELFGPVPHAVIGRTVSERKLSITLGDQNVTTVDLDSVRKVWKRPFQELYG